MDCKEIDVSHYNRPTTERPLEESQRNARSDDAMDDAAKALRQAEIESAQESASANDAGQDESARPRNAK
jgi:hypothetical protein